MAASLNKAILIGNLGRDPEMRHSQGGALIASFSLATSEQWRDKASGERKERTDWHQIVVFNEKLAEIAQKYLRKGMKVYLEGEIRTRKYTDRAGVEKYTTEIVLPRFGGRIEMLDSQRNGPPPAGSPDDYGRQSSDGDAGAGGQPPMRGDMDDDIPF